MNTFKLAQPRRLSQLSEINSRPKKDEQSMSTSSRFIESVEFGRLCAAVQIVIVTAKDKETERFDKLTNPEIGTFCFQSSVVLNGESISLFGQGSSTPCRFGLFGNHLVAHIECDEGGNNAATHVGTTIEKFATARQATGKRPDYLVVMLGMCYGLDRNRDDRTRVDIGSLMEVAHSANTIPEVHERILKAIGNRRSGLIRLPYFLTPDNLGADGQRICDVVVSKEVQHHGHVAVHPEGEINRGRLRDASSGFVAAMRACTKGFDRLVSPFAGRNAAVHFGTYLSGDELINDPTARKNLKEFHKASNPVCGEMEAQGIANSVEKLHRAQTPINCGFVVVKGIMDWGVGKNNNYQNMAVDNSIRFLHHCLSTTNFCGEMFEMHTQDDVIRVLTTAPPPPNGRPTRSAHVGDVPPLPQNAIIRQGDDYRHEDQPVWWSNQLKERVRVAVLNGRSGAGKTTLALQIKASLTESVPASRDAWFDCKRSAFTAKTLERLFVQFVPGERRDEFCRHFPKDEGSVGEREPVFTPWNCIFLKESLLGEHHPPVYLYIDDFDRISADLLDKNSALYTFLQVFLAAPSCVRLVLTARDKARDLKERLCGVDAKEEYTGPLHGHEESVKVIPGGLKGFTHDDVRRYLEQSGHARDLLSTTDFDALINLICADSDALQGGLPLVAWLIEDTLSSEMPGSWAASEKRKWLQGLVEHSSVIPQNAKAEDHLLGKVFATKFQKRLLGDEQKAAHYLSVLTDGAADGTWETLDFQRTDKVMTTILGGGYPALRQMLIAHEIVNPQLVFAHDSYSEFIQQAIPVAVKSKCHLDVAKACLKTEPPEFAAPEFAAWHFMRAGKAVAAAQLLEQFLVRFASEGRFTTLLKLQTRLRHILWPHRENFPEREHWAVNQGRLAETLYNGFTMTSSLPEYQGVPEQSESELAEDCVAGYEADDHENLSVYAGSSMIKTIIEFEDPPRDWESLTQQGKKLLSTLKAIPFSPQQCQLPALAATAASLQACFFNGGARFDEAFAHFDLAEKLINENEARLKAENLWEKVHDFRFCQDRLDVRGCRSRTIFLTEGPKEATSYLVKKLNRARRDHPNVRNTCEFAYAVVNLCYYYTGLNDLSSLENWLDRLYQYPLQLQSGDHPVDPVKLLHQERGLGVLTTEKRTSDPWIIGYVDALEAALLFYRNDLVAARNLFLQLSKRYVDFGYMRDARFMEINACLIDVFSKPQPAVQMLELKTIKELLGKFTDKHGQPDEPIAQDTLYYILARLEGESFDKDCPQITNTLMRFPALLADDGPKYGTRGWMPPLLLRGALNMPTMPCSPSREELQPLDLESVLLA